MVCASRRASEVTADKVGAPERRGLLDAAGNVLRHQWLCQVDLAPG